MASTASAKSVERIEEMMRIVIPFAPRSFACPVILFCFGLRGSKGMISERDRR